MQPYLAWYLTDDATPAPVQATTLVAGTPSALQYFDLWNDNGGTHGDADTAVDLVLRMEVSTDGGATWPSSGEPILDEQWGRIAATGFNNTADPTMPDYETGEVPIGTNADFRLADISKNTMRQVSLRFKPPGSAATFTGMWRLTPIYAESSRPLASGVADALGGGIFSGRMDSAARVIRRGGEITASGIASVTVDARTLDADGVPVTHLAETKALNQNDSAAAALAVGEKYYAVISFNRTTGAGTATKGLKGAAPAKPAVPAGEIFDGYVTVRYDAGGTSIILTADVDQTGVSYGESRVTAGVGLSVIVAPGTGQSTTGLQNFHTAPQVVAGLTNTAVNRIWRHPDGSHSADLNDTPPEVGAVKLAKVTTAGGVVTVIEDTIPIITRAIVEYPLEMKYQGVLSTLAVPALAVAAAVLPFDADLDEVTLDLLSKDGTWTAGAVKIDVRSFAAGAPIPFPAGGAGVGGATIYTNSGTSDQRPSVAYNAANLETRGLNHEVIRFARGTRFVLDVVAVPAAPGAEPPSEIRAVLHFRRI